MSMRDICLAAKEQTENEMATAIAEAVQKDLTENVLPYQSTIEEKKNATLGVLSNKYAQEQKALTDEYNSTVEKITNDAETAKINYQSQRECAVNAMVKSKYSAIIDKYNSMLDSVEK